MVKALKIMRWVTVALMVAIFALQFVPNWKTEKKDISISYYLWFPENTVKIDESEVSIKRLVAQTVEPDQKAPENQEGLKVDDIVVVAICQLVGSVIAFIMYLSKKRGPFAALVPIVAGGAGVIGCLTKAVYQTGAMNAPILGVSAVALVVGVAMFVIGIINLVTEEV